MEVAIAGAHGQVARRLTRLLVARGDRVRGLVRNPDHVAEVVADGADGLVCDLESATDAEIDAAVTGAEAVVFAAGAGPGSGAERKRTLDLGGVVRLVEAARRDELARFVVVSAMGTDDPPQDDEVFSVYLRAKAEADEHVRRSGLQHTIVRPGRLTDDPGTGRVELARHVGRAEVARDDVAAVVAAVLADPATIGRTFEVVGGDVPVAEAVAALADQPDTLDPGA